MAEAGSTNPITLATANHRLASEGAASSISALARKVSKVADGRYVPSRVVARRRKSRECRASESRGQASRPASKTNRMARVRVGETNSRSRASRLRSAKIQLIPPLELMAELANESHNDGAARTQTLPLSGLLWLRPRRISARLAPAAPGERARTSSERSIYLTQLQRSRGGGQRYAAPTFRRNSQNFVGADDGLGWRQMCHQAAAAGRSD